jgi:RNA polymerase sigma factor (sigma-70 family)
MRRQRLPRSSTWRRAINETGAAAVADTSTADHPSELVDAVATLPHNQRAVIVLRCWADLPESEIADIVDVRPGTVRTLAARALATLRKGLPRCPSTSKTACAET